MHVYLYILRDLGRPLSYAEIKARPMLQGRLILGTWGNPEVHAKLLGASDDRSPPKLEHARVLRISNDCVLLCGFQWAATPPKARQTWLCALDKRAGEAALRKIRKPRASDMPLGDWSDDAPS